LRPVTAWVPATGEHATLALAILIDHSGGVNLSSQLSDLPTFIQQQAPTTRVAVGYMRILASLLGPELPLATF